MGPAPQHINDLPTLEFTATQKKKQTLGVGRIEFQNHPRLAEQGIAEVQLGG